MSLNIPGYTNRVLMVRPYQFHKNEQTAANNYYQKDALEQTSVSTTQAAQQEFDAMVARLREVGVTVIVHQDTDTYETPDAVFPNNWISFHPEHSFIYYPMYAPNRRWERNPEVLERLRAEGIDVHLHKDYSFHEANEIYLEGTGSMVLDRACGIAYAALSERTHPELFLQFCSDQGFTAVPFFAFQTVDKQRLPIYHTNVMMGIGPTFATIGLDTIDNKAERKKVSQTLEDSGKEIISLSEDQINQFAGNMLTLIGKSGPVLVMSRAAYRSLEKDQIRRLEKHAQLVHSPLDTIERCGGGSARCMLAELF